MDNYTRIYTQFSTFVMIYFSIMIIILFFIATKYVPSFLVIVILLSIPINIWWHIRLKNN